MCILCTGDYDETITELNLHLCFDITEIPNTLTNLTSLNCSSTNITEIPNTLTHLTTLWCYSTKITEIPNILTHLTNLNCSYTKITEIPNTLTNLTNLYCVGCHWLSRNVSEKEWKTKMEKLTLIQKQFRKQKEKKFTEVQKVFPLYRDLREYVVKCYYL